MAAFRARGEALPPLSSWPRHALLGVLLIGLGNGGVVFAEQWVPSGIAAVIVGSAPFWMAAFEAMLPGGERITARVIAGLTVGFGGLVLLVWPDLTVGGATGRQFAWGLVLLQVACIGWSLGSSYSRRQPAAENPLGASAVQMLLGGIVMLALATLRGEWANLAFTPRALWAELYLIVVGSLAGYSAYIYALKHLPISTVSLYAYINPVIAVILGAALLDEEFGWRIAIASTVVLAGVAIVRTKPPAPKPNSR